jgi:CRP/FNR family transcriptional regulator
MYAPIINHINRFVSLNDTEVAILLPYLQFRSVKKKEHLLKEGQICTANYFIAAGCCRCYFINDKGIEQTFQFGIENWWVTDYASLENKKPSHFYIQAVENSTLIFIDKSISEELFAKLPKLERYFRILLQRLNAASQLRIKYLFSFSGEERYNHFNNSYPEFVQRIPQYMLASYLNFTPEFLSKIRAKKL